MAVACGTAVAPSQLLSRRNPIGQTERQGETMATEKEIGFLYVGKNERHPPNQKVFNIVSGIKHFFADKISGGISAKVRHNDYDGSYNITFAWEGRIFLEIIYGLYGGGPDLCLVQDDHYGPMFHQRVPFTLEELRTKWALQQIERMLASKERETAYSRRLLEEAKIGGKEPAEK